MSGIKLVYSSRQPNPSLVWERPNIEGHNHEQYSGAVVRVDMVEPFLIFGTAVAEGP